MNLKNFCKSKAIQIIKTMYVKYLSPCKNKKYPIYFFRRVYALIVFTFLMAIPDAGIAQNKLTLSQAINNAFVNRKNIQAGKSNLLIQKLQTEKLYSKYWPQVAVEYNYLYNPILQTSILPIGIFNPSYPPDATKNVQFGTRWSQSAGLTVTQPLVDLSIRKQINEAKLQEQITAASQSQSEYELAYTVAQTYIDISLQEAKIKSANADTNRTFISYTLLKNKFDEKRLLKSDLNTAIINHNNAVQNLRNAVGELVKDKVYLLFLTGQHDVENPDIIIDTSLFNMGKMADTSIHPAFDNIPELQQLDLQSQLKVIQPYTEKAKYLPTLSIKGFLGANQYTNNLNPVAANSWFGLSYVGIDVKLPLLIGEDKKRELQILQMQAIQYHLQKEDKAAEYSNEATNATINMRLIMSQLKTQVENLALSTESIAIIQDRVDEGQESSSTLNLDEANLQQLESEYETNKQQLWLYWLDYQKASGQLSLLWK